MWRRLRDFDWETRLRRVEAAGAGVGLLIVALTVTQRAIGLWWWIALAIGAILFGGNLLALVVEPIVATFREAWARSPVEVQIRRKRKKAEAPRAERGFLDFEKDWLRAMDDINAILPKIGVEVEKIGPRLTKHAADLVAAKGARVEVRIRRAKESAHTFKRHADSLGRMERKLREGIRIMRENYMALLANETTRVAVSNPAVLSQMKAGSIAGGTSIDGYRQTVIGIRNLSVEREVNETSDGLANVLGALIGDIDEVVKFCDDALVAIGE